MKIAKIIKSIIIRSLGFPFIVPLILIATGRLFLKMVWNYVRHGAEIAAYEKNFNPGSFRKLHDDMVELVNKNK